MLLYLKMLKIHKFLFDVISVENYNGYYRLCM